MSTKRVTMMKLRELLRLKYEAQLSVRQIALCLSLSMGAVSKYVQRADAAGLDWPLPDELSELGLQALLQPRRSTAASSDVAEPDFMTIEQELKQKGMTRLLLWQEYAQAHPDNH